MNRLFHFITAEGQVVSKSFSANPITYPLSSGSYVATSDPLPFTGSPQTLNLIDNDYKIECNRTSHNNWFVHFSGSDSNVTASAKIFSGSYYTGSMATVLFNFIDHNHAALDVNTVHIKPVNENVGFQHSFVLEDTITKTTDGNGSITVTLVPQPYDVIFKGDVKSTPFQILPSGSCTASAIIVSDYKVARVITPINQSTFGYPATSADVRYVLQGGSIASASYAGYALSASYAINGGSGDSGTVDTSSLLRKVGDTAVNPTIHFTSSNVVYSVLRPIADGFECYSPGADSNAFTVHEDTVVFGSITADTATVNTELYGTASWAQKATTASYALNGGSGGTTLNTGSTYQITASAAVSASKARVSKLLNVGDAAGQDFAGIVMITDSVGESTVLGDTAFTYNPVTFTATVPYLAGTASYATNAKTASYSTNTSSTHYFTSKIGVGQLPSTFTIDAGTAGTIRGNLTANNVCHISEIDLGSGWAYWAQGSGGGIGLGSGHNIAWRAQTTNTSNTGDVMLSRKSSGSLSIDSGSLGNGRGNLQCNYVTASLLGTASWATSASWSPGGAGGGTTLDTGSTYQVTSSWANNAVSVKVVDDVIAEGEQPVLTTAYIGTGPNVYGNNSFTFNSGSATLTVPTLAASTITTTGTAAATISLPAGLTFNDSATTASVTFSSRVTASKVVKFSADILDTSGSAGVAGTHVLISNGAGVGLTYGQVITDVQLFTTTGSSLWYKPTGAKSVQVEMVAGGGGGGGGRKGDVNTARVGGGGGGAGSYIFYSFPASILPPTVSVCVGWGGTTGSLASSNDSNGGNGGNGQSSSFGYYLRANAGTGALGGGNAGGGTAGSAGAGQFQATSAGAASTAGAAGNGSSNQTGLTPIGGAAGGGIGTNNTGSSGGSAGLIATTNSNNNLSGSALNAGTMGNSGGAGLSVPTYFAVGGQGGSGGGSHPSGSAGNGGAGGLYGAGGGGGGSATNNSGSSGYGGTGGQGIVVVTTYF